MIPFAEIREPLVWGCGHPGGASRGHSVAYWTCSAELEGEAADAGQLATPFGLERVERLICAIRQPADVGMQCHQERRV